MIFGAIEAGGTKFVCAVGDNNGQIFEKVQFPTTTPEETMEQVIEFFSRFNLRAIGLGSFGPCDVNFESITYGHITSTPKLSWRGYPILKTLEESFNIPIGFSTDVNAAALGEVTFGAAKGLDSCLYITVGTGIGAGAVLGGELLQGLSHPEMGHVIVRRHSNDTYPGKCPYHRDCLEGLAAGPAIEERWEKTGSELVNRPEVWELESHYLAQALVHYILILSPKKIILGGGVMKQKQLFPLIYRDVKKLLNKYIEIPQLSDEIEKYIVPVGLGDLAGITGALLLGRKAYETQPEKQK
ncbi:MULTISPECIES: ROK family protein [Priestia]|uniref:ROK family protein n=1 Tax=Priestia TaxID=2800373 RepID=UPI0019D5D450|nr:ROK family protein [Priestia megaterium]MBG9472161.1 fructokinase [Priestia megaterium]MDD9793517.1 ROK family protein [Priestia megaterium]